MITCPCNVHPLTPHFYIGKLRFTRVFIFFLIFALKHRLWVLVRTASLDATPAEIYKAGETPITELFHCVWI